MKGKKDDQVDYSSTKPRKKIKKKKNKKKTTMVDYPTNSETKETKNKKRNMEFCLHVANRVLEKNISKGSNVVSSPLSLHVLLSLLASGSSGNTLQQLLSLLESENIDTINLMASKIIDLIGGGENNDGPALSFVNGAWIDNKFQLKEYFEQVVNGVYKSQLKIVDFRKADKVRKEVNSWAKKATKGLIKNLLPSGSLSSETGLVLANALYFKGEWEEKFSQTKELNYHLLNGNVVRAQFMTGGSYSFCGHINDYKVAKIPYRSGNDRRKLFSMYIFLPDDKTGLSNMLERFNSEPGFFNQDFNPVDTCMDKFWIPNFKFSFEFKGKKVMKELGLELPFCSVRAELSEMVESSEDGDLLYVSDIYHKSFIEVDEQGTEATAASSLLVDVGCDQPTEIKYESFVADHPFMFMIREESSRAVFFVGAVLNPLHS